MSKDKKNVEYIIYLIFYEKEFNVSVIYVYACILLSICFVCLIMFNT